MGFVLVASEDSHLRELSAAVLEAAGFETLTAHNAHSAEYVLDRHDIEVVVIDAKIPAEDPPRRPFAILEAFPKPRFVVIHASLLSTDLRRVLGARGSIFLESADGETVTKAVRELLPEV